MSKISGFYTGIGTDDQGRTLDSYMSFNDEQLERVHDYIQWMFPLNEKSEYNPNAPILTKEDIEIIDRNKIKDSFYLFLDFLSANRGWIFSVENHNWKRISRIIKCLRLFGFDTIARLFYDTCLMFMKDSNSPSIKFWQEALTKELWN